MLVFLAISVHVSALRQLYLLQVRYFKIALIACVCGKYFKEDVTSDFMKYSTHQSSNITYDFSFLQKCCQTNKEIVICQIQTVFNIQ